jgi:hypothetical protein
MEEKSLFKIGQELEDLLNSLAESGGEISEDTESQLAKVSEALIQKADQCISWRDKMLMYREHALLKASEIEHIAKKISDKIEKFDEYVLSCVKRLPSQKIEGEFVSIKLRKPAQVVEIYDETQIDVEFIKIPEPKPMIMKTEIAKALKAGLEVSGARLIEGKQSVIYKVGKE